MSLNPPPVVTRESMRRTFHAFPLVLVGRESTTGRCLYADVFWMETFFKLCWAPDVRKNDAWRQAVGQTFAAPILKKAIEDRMDRSVSEVTDIGNAALVRITCEARAGEDVCVMRCDPENISFCVAPLMATLNRLTASAIRHPDFVGQKRKWIPSLARAMSLGLLSCQPEASVEVYFNQFALEDQLPPAPAASSAGIRRRL